MWFIGFIFHEMAFGLLSIFLPLYVTGQLGSSLSGSLTDFGLMTAIASFMAVPFSFFWGYLCDKTRRYRVFILLSFLALTCLLYLFTLTDVLPILIILYAIIAVFHTASEAPKNVLIAESYSRQDWERGFASFEAFTEVGTFTGLLLGFVLTVLGFGGTFLLLISALLNLMALLLSFFFVEDPILPFERGIVKIEKVMGTIQRGVYVASKALEGVFVEEKLSQENVSVFCLGLTLFSFATSVLFTPLPIFFSKTLQVPSNVVFGIFFLNSFGAFFGYTLSKGFNRRLGNKTAVADVAIVRSILTVCLVPVILMFSMFTLSLSVAILALMGLTYAFFVISTISLSMELIPQGKAGIYNALVGLGTVLGCFIGPFVAQQYGFTALFLLSSLLFASSFVMFKVFSR
jgi:MFS family permease